MRTLRQGIKLIFKDAAGNQKVSGSFWCRLCQIRCLHFQKILTVQVVTNCAGYLVTKFEVFCHLTSTQIQIAIFLSQLFSCMGVLIEFKRKRLTTCKDLNCLCSQLHLSRLDCSVDKAGFSLDNFSCNSNHIFFM